MAKTITINGENIQKHEHTLVYKSGKDGKGQYPMRANYGSVWPYDKALNAEDLVNRGIATEGDDSGNSGGTRKRR